jgi:hypothetical protein
MCDTLLFQSPEMMESYLLSSLFFVANESGDAVESFGTSLDLFSSLSKVEEGKAQDLAKVLSQQIPSLDKYFTNLEKIWPSDGFAYPSDILADHKVVGNHESVFRTLDVQSGKEVTFDRDTLSAVTNPTLYDVMELDPIKAKALADPSTPRPKIKPLSAYQGGFNLLSHLPQCIGVRKKEFKQLIDLGSKIDFFKLSKDPEIQNLSQVSFESKKFPKFDKILEVVKRNLINQVETTNTNTNKVIDIETKNKGKALLNKYCSECHGEKEEGKLELTEKNN